MRKPILSKWKGRFKNESRRKESTDLASKLGALCGTTLSPWFELPHHPEPVDGSKGIFARGIFSFFVVL